MVAIRKRTWTTKKGGIRTAWAVDFVDMSGCRERHQFATKREADAFRVKVESDLRSGTYRPDAHTVTVRETADLFLENCTARFERGERMTRHNLAVYSGHVRNYICADRNNVADRPRRAVAFDGGIGSMKLAQLSASKVGDLRDRLRTAGVSVPTVRKILATLHVMLEFAVSRDLIAVNPARRVRVIGPRGEGPKKVAPPSREVLRRLIAVADPDFRRVLILASATGLRAGELHALRWKHLDLKTGRVLVETRVDAYNEEDVTKSAAGMRTLPLGADVVSMLKEWRLQSPYSDQGDLVFPNARGGYTCHGNMVKRKFRPLFERLASLHCQDPDGHPPASKRFTWHALRHFAISSWIDAGLTPKTVQTFAGHSSLQVTMDRYGHLFPSDDHKKAMDAISQGLVS